MNPTGWGWISFVAAILYASLAWLLLRQVKRGLWPRWQAAGVIGIVGLVFLFIFMQWASWYK